MKNENINFNKSECIKEYDKLGTTIYQNVCTGEKTKLPWGIGGWTLFIFVILVCLLIITMGICFAKALIFDN